MIGHSKSRLLTFGMLFIMRLNVNEPIDIDNLYSNNCEKCLLLLQKIILEYFKTTLQNQKN